jgi:Predicted metal-dependent enzyme
MDKNNKCNLSSPRLGTVGGQAVLEGVMMKSKDKVALSVRDLNGNIQTEVTDFTSKKEKNKLFGLPLIRGVVNFVEMMILSFHTLTRSADMLGIEEEESKFEKWLTKKFGKSLTAVASVVGSVLGIGLSILLFLYLPSLISDLTIGKTADIKILKSLVEGVTKMAIFIAYVGLVGLIPDMKRTFQYHGAEHKSIFCHESEVELTPKNVKKFSRFHPRCGTSFLVVMMVIGILVSVFYINFPRPLRVATKLITLPLIVALGYEFIRYAGKHNNLLVRILSAPGLWVQRLTTKEPDEKQIEVAIRSLKAALPDIYPEIIEELQKNDNNELTDTTSEGQ